MSVPAKRRLSRIPRVRGFGTAAVLLAIWILGLVAVVAVVDFGSKVDRLRHAQVVIARLQVQENALVGTVPQLQHAQRAINDSLKTLAGLDHSNRPARIAALSRRHFRSVVAGASNRPGGVETTLDVELDQANIADGRAAENARTVASVGTTLAIFFMLIAFSVAFHDAVRARRRAHRDATTDALTGLGNRRKLVADMEPAIQSLGTGETMEIGIFDLNGFKAYNDAFGHPAGDVLLARLGHRLADAVGDCGSAYRIGGDEFVVVATVDAERMLAAAQEALSERTDRSAISCSRGSTRIAAGTTFADALRVADRNLYTEKRTARGDRRLA